MVQSSHMLNWVPRRLFPLGPGEEIVAKRRKIIPSFIGARTMHPTRTPHRDIKHGARLDRNAHLIAVLIMVVFIAGGLCVAVFIAP